MRLDPSHPPIGNKSPSHALLRCANGPFLASLNASGNAAARAKILHKNFDFSLDSCVYIWETHNTMKPETTKSNEYHKSLGRGKCIRKDHFACFGRHGTPATFFKGAYHDIRNNNPNHPTE